MHADTSREWFGGLWFVWPMSAMSPLISSHLLHAYVCIPWDTTYLVRYRQYEAAKDAAVVHVQRFGEGRERVLGDYFRPVSDAERVQAFNAALPKISKRVGLKPEDVGTALLAHMHDSLSASIGGT
jgi:hypothetical protein